VYRFGHAAGQCFAAVQGGPYASDFAERLVNRIRRLGVEGVGQSSWGPTVFAVTQHHADAQSLIESLEAHYEQSLHFIISKPDNSGFSHHWR
jgi:predicted sugar kinase